MRIKPIVQAELTAMVIGLGLGSGVLNIPEMLPGIEAGSLSAAGLAAGIGVATGGLLGALVGIAFALEELARLPGRRSS